MSSMAIGAGSNGIQTAGNKIKKGNKAGKSQNTGGASNINKVGGKNPFNANKLNKAGGNQFKMNFNQGLNKSQASQAPGGLNKLG